MRDYTLSGTAYDEGILTLIAPKTLNVETASSAHANTGTFTAYVTVDMDVDNHPYLTPLKQITRAFTVIIDAACFDTEFIENKSIVGKMAFVGEEAVVWRFNEW